ncbi:MAG: hypothetical protein DRI97_18270 [Bacteroidetes bacterium]|nr:MAG: hypothetical protein DRI97_18270 [Bacteroidota bacterium]
MKRREFLRNSLAGTALLSTFPYELLAGTKKLYPSDRVQLGNTGIEMSRMAMGTGTRGFGGSSNQTRQLGIKGSPIFFWQPMMKALISGRQPISMALIPM